MDIVNWLFLFYFVGLHGVYLMLTVSSMLYLPKFLREHSTEDMSPLHAHFEPPVTIIVPAYNEAATIASSVRALMQLEYPEYEIIVINDGSTDNTLDVLIDKFSLHPFPEVYHIKIKTKPVTTIYRSTKFSNIRVIDKTNGGKADSINTGINASYYPLYCCVDADSVLERNSLKKVVRPFIEDPETVASGGVVRILNGCSVKDGFISKVGLSKNILALFQVVEYLRAFMFGRLGWTPMNALLIISGAFGVFKKETVIAVGGYKTNCIGEDMELVVRLHRTLIEQGRPYKIHFVPDPVCWTEAPEKLSILKNQRMRWQIGLAESLMANKSLLFNRKGGAVSWLAFPFFLIFECFGPLLEVSGFVIIVYSFYSGLIPNEFFLIFMMLAVGLGMLISVISLSLEEVSFRSSNNAAELLLLFIIAIIENIGYRQLNAIWRVMGMYNWLTKSENKWGKMDREASWDDSME
jgi:cellulose synthase/poly-beta-1,6-N-acetylglucosamine synthase-like glycosyltransferase